MTRALEGMESLEDAARRWNGRLPAEAIWRPLVTLLAGIAARMHGAGFVHKDFYICHLLKPVGDELLDVPYHVIDLHRAQHFGRIPPRWVVKDSAAMFYSLAEVGWASRAVRDAFESAYTGEFPAASGLRADIEARFRSFSRNGLKKGLISRELFDAID